MAKFEIDFLPDYSEEALLDELRRVARVLGRNSLSRRDIDEHGKVSSATVLKRFGSLRQALQTAGLRPTRFMKATDDELLDFVEEVWVASLERHGRRPHRSDLRSLGHPVSADTITRRFGSWKKALIAAASRAERDGTSHAVAPADSTPPTSPAAHDMRRALSVRKRFFVLKRDLYRCRLCGATGVPLEVDHIVPHARGGADELDNLQALCVACNRGKRDSLQ